MAKCNQKNCESEGVYRFTWPGQDEQVICEDHVGKLRGVANAMGLHLQIRPVLPPADPIFADIVAGDR